MTPRRIIQSLGFAFAVMACGQAAAAPFLQAEDTQGALRATITPAALQAKQNLDLLIGDKRYVLVADRVAIDVGGRYWEGHVQGNPAHKVSLRATGDGVAGVLDLPGRPLRLGYTDKVHWLLDTPRAEIQAELPLALPQLFVPRATAASDNAGDRRAVAAHDEKPAEVAYPITLNLAELAGVEPGQRVQLSMPGNRLQLTYDETLLTPEGTRTWVGHLSDYGPDYRALLTYSPDGSLTGSIIGPQGELLVSGKPGKPWLIDAGASKLVANPHAIDNCSLVPPETAKVSTRTGAASTAAAAGKSDFLQSLKPAKAEPATTTSTSPTAGSTPTTPTTVDILVLYTPGLVSRYGGEAGAQTRIDHFITLANKAYADSGVALTLRKVGTQSINVADNTSNSTTLSALRGNTGAFANVGTLRNSKGADAVVMIRPFYAAAQGNSCGVAYIGGYNLQPMANYANSAYGVVSEGRDMAGSSYYCVDYTFAHELGHNMGLMHDRETVTRQGGGMGALAYAYGYGLSGRFGTIMSYISPVVGKFSNPRDLSCASGPCGVADTSTTTSADNAKALGITKDPFSAYRTSTVASQVSVSGTVTVDGKAALNLPVLANGSACGNTGSTGAYACTFTAGWTGTLSVTAANVTFTPAQQSYSNLQTSASQNFAGVTQATTTKVAISGTATVNGTAASGVVVNAGTIGCGTTPTTGAFTCSVPSGWSGNVTGTRTGASFTPVSLSNVTAARTVSLVGTASTTSTSPVTISGTVTRNGVALAGAQVNIRYYTGSGTPSCSLSDSTGRYTCTVQAQGSGTLVPYYAGVNFSPATANFSNIVAPMTVNFSGKTPIVIQGVVTVGGIPRSGASVNAGTTLCGVTNTSGAYSCTRAYGWSGRVAPVGTATAAVGGVTYRDITSLTSATTVNFVLNSLQ